MCVHACRGQRTTLRIIPQVLFTLDFDTWSLVGLELGELYYQEALGIYLPVSASQAVELQRHATMSGFLRWVLGTGSGPYTCKASTLPAEPSPSPLC